ncbi:MAG TPA: hypothetical protein VLI93_09740 [Acetobacteraceae bacterium]|nr:hypothetical protein [Acetobacteraceae bacterium]
MTADDSQNAWVLRVLGVAVGGAAANSSAPARSPGELLPLWSEAKEATDKGIEQLQHALRGLDDPDFQKIAEYGLNGATTGQSTNLIVALREMDSAATPRNRAKLQGAVQAFREFLDGSPIVHLLEDNPFGVVVPIRDSLGPVLDEIQRAIAA